MGRENPTPALAGAKPLVGGDESTPVKKSENIFQKRRNVDKKYRISIYKSIEVFIEMLKAYKYRVYPNQEQKVLISKHFGCARFIYNQGLATKIKSYEETGKSPSCIQLTNSMLMDLKDDKSHLWLKEVSAQSLQMSLRNLDNAFTRFFREKKGFPKFKSKHKSIQSCQFPQSVRCEFKKKRIILPKIGGLKTVFSREFEGKIKTTTLSKTSTNKYYVSILVDNLVELPKKVGVEEQTTIGIDLGIKDFCIISNGEKISNPKYLRNNIERIKVLQKRKDVKKKGSTRRFRQNKKVEKKHEYVKNIRQDFLHKLSSKIISENQTICLEDLNVSGMMKNHCLAQSISDVGWGKFVELLTYKADWYGKNVLQIGRFEASSKICSVCGEVNKLLTLKDREWICKCGVKHDRDLNAAANIKKFGLIRYEKYKNYSGAERPGEPVEMSGR